MIPEVTCFIGSRETGRTERKEGRTVEEREGKGGQGRTYLVIDLCSHLLRGHG